MYILVFSCFPACRREVRNFMWSSINPRNGSLNEEDKLKIAVNSYILTSRIPVCYPASIPESGCFRRFDREFLGSSRLCQPICCPVCLSRRFQPAFEAKNPAILLPGGKNTATYYLFCIINNFRSGGSRKTCFTLKTDLLFEKNGISGIK